MAVTVADLIACRADWVKRLQDAAIEMTTMLVDPEVIRELVEAGIAEGQRINSVRDLTAIPYASVPPLDLSDRKAA